MPNGLEQPPWQGLGKSHWRLEENAGRCCYLTPSRKHNMWRWLLNSKHSKTLSGPLMIRDRWHTHTHIKNWQTRFYRRRYRTERTELAEFVFVLEDIFCACKYVSLLGMKVESSVCPWRAERYWAEHVMHITALMHNNREYQQWDQMEREKKAFR